VPNGRGFRCILMRCPADCAGPPSIWMHGRNCVFGQPALFKAHTGGGADAIVRPVSLVFDDFLSVDDDNGSSPNGRTGGNASGVPRRTLYTKVWCIHHHSLGAWRTCDGASILHIRWVGTWEWRRGWSRSRMQACERATRWQGARRADLADAPWRHAATPDLTTSLHILCPLRLVAYCLWYIMQHRCFDARNALGSALHLPRAFKTLHDTMLHLFNTARSCLSCMTFANCCSGAHPFWKGMLLRASSPVRAMLLFQWFCSGFRFCCGFPDFLFFWRDLWVILVLCISSLFEKFSLCRFPPFSRNCRSGWFLFCEGTLGTTPRRFNSLGPNPNKRPLTVHPTTLDSSFPRNHTLPTHPHTHSSHTPPHNHTLDKIISEIFLSESLTGSRLVGVPRVNSQPCRFTSNSLGFPPAHSLSVCLFLWVCVVCVCFLLYPSF